MGRSDERISPVINITHSVCYELLVNNNFSFLNFFAKFARRERIPKLTIKKLPRVRHSKMKVKFLDSYVKCTVIRVGSGLSCYVQCLSCRRLAESDVRPRLCVACVSQNDSRWLKKVEQGTSKGELVASNHAQRFTWSPGGFIKIAALIVLVHNHPWKYRSAEQACFVRDG